ncbi:MAG: transposase [Atopobiaceae bacterium]|jgi:transposase|nr:transposase [Atopobiaceae bacterium]
MSVSASEIERLESRPDSKGRRRYTEEYRVEAVKYYEKAREIDPKKTIKDCARELGINDKTLNDWVIKFQDAGKVTRERSEEQKALDEANRRIRELELENEFLKKAAAFFARDLA